MTTEKDPHREQLVKHCDDSMVEAYDVYTCLQRAAKYGLEIEWFASFIGDLKSGVEPVEAAVGACRDWDC